MSAPIPSFFKIRCVLVIISILLFFMLIGMTRQVFALDCSIYAPKCNVYTSSTKLNSDYNLLVSPWFFSGDGGCNPGFACVDCFGCPAGSTYKSKTKYNANFYLVPKQNPYADVQAFALVAQCPAGMSDDDNDGKCDLPPCYEEQQSLAAQCGETGYTIIDEENCKGRCNDCVQSAEEQCPEPGIIVWNEDGDCSYNCSEDTDGDGWPDIDDPDDDNDGMDDDDDPCPTNPDPNCVKPKGPDSDGDGRPDVSDPDADMDGDGLENWEDDDDDGDGVKDISDLDADPDGDGLLNWEDDDDDGDGKLDTEDPDADPDGDGKTNDEDPDDDNDGVPDVEDPDNDKYHSNEPAYSVNSTLSEMLKARFQQFLDDVKMSSLFSIPERIKQGVPSGGDSSLSVEMGETFGGTHVVEFSGWSQGLAVMNALFYTVCSGIAIRIIILKR